MKGILFLSFFLFSITNFSQSEADTCGFYVSPTLSIENSEKLTVYCNCPLPDFKFVLRDKAGVIQYESEKLETPMSLDVTEVLHEAGDINRYFKGETYSWTIFYKLSHDTDQTLRKITGTITMN
jgi:hypothetical protein